MAEKKEPYDWILTKTATAGSNDVVSDYCPPGEIWCSQHLATENMDNDPTLIRVFKDGAGGEFPLDDDPAPAEDKLFVIRDNWFVHPGQRFLIRFTGCTAGDRLRGYITGYKERREG